VTATTLLSIPAWLAFFVLLDVAEKRFPWVSVAGYAALSALQAFAVAASVLTGQVTGWTWLKAAFVGVFAWEAWRRWRRNRKDRKPSRVLGVVRNLGHRLAVVPVPGGAR
jgi:membrane protein implicated in regulation of membrane protease activity